MEVVEGQLIDENQINSSGECRKCKQKGVSKKQIGIIILGFYLLFSSIYGTIVILNNLKDFIFNKNRTNPLEKIKMVSI